MERPLLAEPGLQSNVTGSTNPDVASRRNCSTSEIYMRAYNDLLEEENMSIHVPISSAQIENSTIPKYPFGKQLTTASTNSPNRRAHSSTGNNTSEENEIESNEHFKQVESRNKRKLKKKLKQAEPKNNDTNMIVTSNVRNPNLNLNSTNPYQPTFSTSPTLQPQVATSISMLTLDTTTTLSQNWTTTTTANHPTTTSANHPTTTSANHLTTTSANHPTTQSALIDNHHNGVQVINNQNESNSTISDEAKAFASTRFPFPPFILRFDTPAINVQAIIKALCEHLKDNLHLELELCGYRKSSIKCTANQADLLIFVKTSESFSMLYNDDVWPQSLANLTFTRLPKPSIPPQLSLIIKNVSLSIDLNDFANDLKTEYSNVQNVVRLKNKNQSFIRWVKIEFSNPTQRTELLKRRKIFVNSLAYDIEEYLAPAKVLICSKCQGIGHFRKHCSQEKASCRKCGEHVDNLTEHIKDCETTRCKHCQGDHSSNDMKCPIVKRFRSDLTKALYSSVAHSNRNPNNFNYQQSQGPRLKTGNEGQTSTTTTTSNTTGVNQSTGRADHSSSIDRNHPNSNSQLNINILTKLDQLVSNLTSMNQTLTTIADKQSKFDQFILEKNNNDEVVRKKMENLEIDSVKNAQQIKMIETNISKQENLLGNLVMPLLNEITVILSKMKLDVNIRASLSNFNQLAGKINSVFNTARSSPTQ